MIFIVNAIYNILDDYDLKILRCEIRLNNNILLKI